MCFSDLIRSKQDRDCVPPGGVPARRSSPPSSATPTGAIWAQADPKGNIREISSSFAAGTAQRAVATVLELCKTRLPDNMHIPAEQIQVLTPTRKGPCGTTNLNRVLQEALNPRTPGKREILWGERVFRVRETGSCRPGNDYDVVWQKADGTVGTGMFNGDVGRIAEIDAGGELAGLDFDGRKAPYSVEMLSEIDLAYAQTVHKAQGSEYQLRGAGGSALGTQSHGAGGAVYGADPGQRAAGHRGR